MVKRIELCDQGFAVHQGGRSSLSSASYLIRRLQQGICMTALSTPNCRPAACTVLAAVVALALNGAGLAQTRPTTKPAAPPAATTAPASHPTSAPAADLPKGEDLVNAGLEAMGGKKAFD